MKLSLLWQSVRMAFQALLGNKFRTILTILGILIGITTLIFIHSVMKGAEDFIVQQSVKIGTRVLNVSKWEWFGNRKWWELRKRKQLTLEHFKRLTAMNETFPAITAMQFRSSSVNRRDKKLGQVEVVGASEDYVYTTAAELSEGSFFNKETVRRRSTVVVLGSEIANLLFPQEIALGKSVTVAGKSFTVVGVMSKQGEVFGQSLDNRVIIPITTWQSLFQSRFGMLIQVAVSTTMTMEEGEEILIGYMRTVRGLRSDVPADFSINKMDTIVKMYNDMTFGIRIALIVIGALSLVVGGIGIMNIMLVTVSERTREIGIRKALGAKNSDILMQFLVEAVTVSAAGGVVGVLLGFASSQALASFSSIPASVSLSSTLLGLGFSSFIGITFGFFPARKAARLSPTEAMRSE